MTQTSVRAFEAFLSAAFRAHLVRVASGAWAPDEGLTATRRELFVGFVDLVGYTALARTMSTGQLARLLSAFEDVVGEAVGAGGGRLVKLIGDSAMFVTDSPAAGCRVALDLCRRLEESDVLPAGRGGGDYGTVLSLRGDYFGDVVNRAARFVALARSATVVVSDVVAAAAGAGFTFERLPPRALKGFQSPMAPFRVLPG
jgi:adenylate cyclase